MEKETTVRISKRLVEMVRGAKQIVLCAHVNPDGDTLGSCLALRLALCKLGKEARVICQDKTPDYLAFLSGAETVCRPEDLGIAQPELFLAVDVSDERRLGSGVQVLETAHATCQIDHHGTNPAYAQVNAIDPDASATGLLAYELIQQLGVPVDVEMAKCLYTAISTDTGNFSFDNTSARTFRVMGELMNLPLPLAQMNRTLFRERSKAQILLLSRALSSLTFDGNGRIAGMRLTHKDFVECGALPEHADAIVNFALDVEGVKMAYLVRENDMGQVKASLRGIAPYAVDGIAASFGGGGHALAAGCTLGLSMEESVRLIVLEMERELEREDA